MTKRKKKELFHNIELRCLVLRVLHHTVTVVGFLLNNVKTLKSFIIDDSNILPLLLEKPQKNLALLKIGFQDICRH